jgi:uncharacterized Zn finger protein
MLNIKRFFTTEFLTQNAIPSNFVYGTAIYEHGAVEFISNHPSKIEAWAGGLEGTIKEGAGSRRRVTFTIEDGKLHWHCTGNPKNHQIFCKHCVAVALATTRES